MHNYIKSNFNKLLTPYKFEYSIINIYFCKNLIPMGTSNKIFKFYFLLLLFAILISCSQNKEDCKLYEKVDEAIAQADTYQKEKERTLDILKQRLNLEKDPLKQKEITDLLIQEYESYESDSAFHYINLNLNRSEVREGSHDSLLLMIKKADLAAHAGLFGEAHTMLEEIGKNKMDSTLLENYYSAFCDLYQYQIEYTHEGEYADQIEKLRESYADSLIKYASSLSFVFIVNKSAKELRRENYGEAENLIKSNLDFYKSGQREYSILNSLLAEIKKLKGDQEGYKRHLAKSVISDIKGSIKENMAIRALATVYFDEGDVEKADRYLRKSFKDANFFAARMRNAQSSRILPIVGEALNNEHRSLNDKLRGLLISISVLALILIGIIIFALKQVKIVRKANAGNEKMLADVCNLSKELSKVNSELSEANERLKHSNAITEEYAGLFMEYSSMAMSSLHQYNQSLKVLVAQGNIKNLVKKIESFSTDSKTLNEFYSKFDEAILNIYPQFIEKFNQLLKPDEQVLIKPGERLTTELRVFALMRIGIHDPEKIANFLRCSVATIYTYRSRMKKRAISPANFEEEILKF